MVLRRFFNRKRIIMTAVFGFSHFFVVCVYSLSVGTVARPDESEIYIQSAAVGVPVGIREHD